MVRKRPLPFLVCKGGYRFGEEGLPADPGRSGEALCLDRHSPLLFSPPGRPHCRMPGSQRLQYKVLASSHITRLTGATTSVHLWEASRPGAYDSAEVSAPPRSVRQTVMLSVLQKDCFHSNAQHHCRPLTVTAASAGAPAVLAAYSRRGPVSTMTPMAGSSRASVMQRMISSLI